MRLGRLIWSPVTSLLFCNGTPVSRARPI